MRTHRLWKIAATAGLALALIASASLVALAGGGQPVSAQSADNALLNTITVTGSGQASGAPDVAYLSLGVDTINADLSAAVTEADQTMTAVVAAVQALGIAPEDIQTVNYSVWTQDSGPGGQLSDRAYHLSNIISITLRDTNAVQDVLNAALEAGANSIQGLNFGIQDSASLEQEARLQALDDARQRATQIAEADRQQGQLSVTMQLQVTYALVR